MTHNDISNTIHEASLLFSSYEAGTGLKAALTMSREDILFELKASKLKGRGGAGFPTSTKWMLVAAAKGDDKFIICNADEGEPGTFKDRVLLMNYPFLVLDGMVIGGYTVGAQHGYIYLRGEYVYMKDYLEECLQEMRENNMLGDNILGKEGFNFDISIVMGAGAYVCGEETALIESLEGQRGEPRNRPPYPVNTGLCGAPTTVNNVETLATVPHIILMGGEKYAEKGTAGSTGSKLFSVSGDCERPGVYELNWGITINGLLEKVGARNTKAVQVGGASGICVPKSKFDRALAFEDAATGGSIMIFNESRSMLQVLKNFMDFFVEESCGQCTPCRLGNQKLLEGVEMIERNNFTFAHINNLKELAQTMKVASKCGLGQSSPNPFLSILEDFKGEIFHSKVNGGVK